MPFRSRVFITFLLLLPATLFATTAIELSDADLTAQAELIVAGTVTETRSQWVDPRNLVTLATVSVSEVLKGSAGPTITVDLPGGVDANRKFPISMSYPGAPQMGKGERVFLFLIADDVIAGGYAIVGFAQGKFTIVGSDSVTRKLDDLQLAGPRGVGSGNRTITSYDQFKRKIQGYVKAQRR